MKKRAVWAILAVVVVVAAAGWWYFGTLSVPATTENTLLDSLTPVENTLGIFRTDANSLYFVDTEHVSGAPLDQVTEKATLVSGADKNTFVVDGGSWSGDIFVLSAHDAIQTYVAEQVRVSCAGDTRGCIDSTSLTVAAITTAGKDNEPDSFPSSAAVTTLSVASGSIIVGFEQDPFEREENKNSILKIEYGSAYGDPSTDLTGWKIESKSTGLSYTLPVVTASTNPNSNQPKTIPPRNIVIWLNEGGAYIALGTHGFMDGAIAVPDNVKEATGGVYYLLHTNAKTWNTNHDTITIRDASGKVMGTLVY